MKSSFDSDICKKTMSPKWAIRRGKIDPSWNPIRLSGRLKFRKSRDGKTEQDWSQNGDDTTNLVPRHKEFRRSGYQFHNYCQHTSLHGFRYITEGKRSIGERIFWICWCIFGISSAIYMMSKIWQKWQDNPVLTSIATTNLPVSEINFPAVTICTVNKAVSEKLIIQDYYIQQEHGFRPDQIQSPYSPDSRFTGEILVSSVDPIWEYKVVVISRKPYALVGCNNKPTIILGCRFNFTLTQMRQIISSLVDPESRNNDNDKAGELVDSRKAMKFLRLVSPKCETMLLRCQLNGQNPSCKELFKLVLTDSGYCCTFNSMDANSRIVVDAINDTELLKQEEEFLYLQKAVWQYHDRFRDKNGNPEAEFNNTKPAVESLTCSRIYDDDLFPGICRYLRKCRHNPASCHLNFTSASTTSPPDIIGSGSSSVTPGKNGSTLFRAPGAGRSRGLTLMTDTLRCDDVPTDSFKGLRIGTFLISVLPETRKVYVHGADEFPAVSEKGFIVGPGKETQVGVTAIDAYSADALIAFKASNRECYFGSEFKLEYYKEYSRSSCVIECENKFIYQECQCVPYYSPAAGNYTICTMQKMLDCVEKAIDAIQRRKVTGSKEEARGIYNLPFNKRFGSFDVPCPPIDSIGPGKPMFNFKAMGSQEQDKTCIDFCLPACNETFYNIVVSSATFPNQNNPNKTKMLREAIAEGFVNLADINYVSGSISLLRVYFRESTIMQYKRDELFTWEDFVSNLGGVMSLCLGFSLLSLIEVIYFFTIRQIIDRRRHQKEHRQN